MKRMGVGTGDVVNYPLVGPLSTRDIGGFALDVATDPLTLVSKISKPLSGMNYAGKAADTAGKSMVKSGVKKIDQAVLEKGAEPLSNILLERGISGNSSQIRDATEQILKDTKAERDALHSTADNAVAMIDPNVAFKDALDKAVALGERDPGMKDLAEKLQNKIQSYIDYGTVPLSQASEWKTNLYNALPEAAYDKFGKLKGPADRIQKSMASGLKNAIETEGNAVIPGLGDKIASANETMQTILASRKPLKTAAKAEKGVNAFTSVDAMLAGGGLLASHDPATAAALLAMKKAGDISKTTRFRTGAGQALMGLGQNPLTTPVVNRALIDSPWMDMQQQQAGGQ
jgi:hypothetical protein